MSNTNPLAGASGVTPYPSTRAAWVMVCLLTVAYVLSYVDRYVLYLLVEPIQKDLGLTDTQMGWLIGPAFGLLYALSGLFFGWLSDHRRRTYIVAAGITIWSSAMLFCGMAKNFLHLFTGRMAVGAGEAALSPCAMSMISDSFPPERRARPIAFYAAAVSLGGGTASLLGGSILAWAKRTEEVSLPLLGELEAWQFTFAVLALPGLLFGLVFLFLKEPPRIINDALLDKSKTNLLDMLKYLRQHWWPFFLLISIFASMSVMALTHSWHAVMFSRVWGWDASQYAFGNGIVLICSGPASVLAAGWLCDRWATQGKKDAPVVIALIGIAIIVPTEILKSLASTPELALFILALNTVGFAMTSAVGVTALLNIAPVRIKAQTIAFYYLVMSLAGSFIGPPTIGWLNDNVFLQPDGIRYSMMVLPVLVGLPVVLFSPLIRRVYVAEVERRMSHTAT